MPSWSRLLPSTAIVATLVVDARLAVADCPTDISETAPIGFLADVTRAVTSPDEPTPHGFEARLDAAGGMRAVGGAGAVGDGSEHAMDVSRDIDGTAAIGGELRLQRGSKAACLSADLVDISNASAHVTASAQVPLLFTGLRAGFTYDRDITLPLAARPEYLRAPISRITGSMSLAFLDFSLRDGHNALRMLVVPFTVEQGVARQDATPSGELYRRTVHMEAEMMRFVATDTATQSDGDFGLFRIEVDWTEPLGAPSYMTPLTTDIEAIHGVARFSLLSFLYRGTEWGWELDGGVLSLAGPFDCEAARVDCGKGWFRGALRHSWSQWSLEGRVERDAFIAADNLPAVDNRATVSATIESGATQVSGAVFASHTHAWVDGAGGQRAGLRARLAHALGHGFSGQLDSEVVASNAMQPELGSGVRLLASLAWHKDVQR